VHGDDIDGVVGLVERGDEDHPRPRPDQESRAFPAARQRSPGKREALERSEGPLDADEGIAWQPESVDQAVQILHGARREKDARQALGELVEHGLCSARELLDGQVYRWEE
jgi:hypothetical protein